MKRILKNLVFLLGSIVAAPVLATTWDDNIAVGGGNSWTMTVNVGGVDQIVRVRGYATQTVGSQTGTWTNNVTTSLFTDAGFGVGNNNAGDQNEGTPPEHATDNNQIYDVLVFELPGTNWDLEGFRLGWAQDGTTADIADTAVFYGGNSIGGNYDFTQACFSGCSNTLSSLGFTNLMDTGVLRNSNTNAVISGSDNNTPENVTVTATGTQQGRYLVMAGVLGGSNDHFKVEMIKASGGNVPVPGTLALLGLGLFGLAALRRKQA